MNEKTGFWRRTYTIPFPVDSAKTIVRIITLLALISAAPCVAQETDQPVFVVQGGSKAMISSIAFSPDGRWLLISDALGVTKLFSVKTGKLLRRFANSGRVSSSVFSPDGRLMVTGASDGSVKLWDFQAGVELRSFTGHNRGIDHVEFSRDGGWILTRSSDGTAFIWNTETGAQVLKIGGTDEEVRSVALTRTAAGW